MKLKVWILPAQIITLLVLLIVLTILSLIFDGAQLFVIDLTITLIALGMILWRTWKFGNYMHEILTRISRKLRGPDIKTLNEYPMPSVAVSEQGEIIYYNELFRYSIMNGEDVLGGKINKIFSGFDLSDLEKEKVIEVKYGQSRYSMFINQSFGAHTSEYIILFHNISVLRDIQDEYNESRPVVITVLFDNKDELAQIVKESEIVKLNASIESLVENWVSETSGVVKRLDGGKFLIIVEERHIRSLIEKKFSILDEARKIKADERNWVTLSIGVGRGGKTFAENENRARLALDMCLGRGGDQAAVKSDDGYIFFGGISKTVEKRSKVRTRTLAVSIAGLIAQNDTIFIMGHKFSDLDSVGAAIGMYALAVKLGKNAKIICEYNTSLAKQLADKYVETAGKNMFITPDRAESEIQNPKTLLIIVDTHSPKFVESEEIYKMSKQVVVIDHHRKIVNHIDNAVIFFHEPYASSTCEMVTELIECIDERAVSRYEAEALMAGIMLDTKNFVLRTGVRTFEASAYLRRRGADTVEVKGLFADSLDTYMEKSQLVASAEIIDNCAIASADNSFGNIRIASAQAADELLTIQGVNASFVIYQTETGVSISARSLGKLNVQLVMEELGGGGHQTMAGAQLSGNSLEQARERLILAIRTVSQKD